MFEEFPVVIIVSTSDGFLVFLRLNQCSTGPETRTWAMWQRWITTAATPTLARRSGAAIWTRRCLSLVSCILGLATSSAPLMTTAQEARSSASMLSGQILMLLQLKHHLLLLQLCLSDPYCLRFFPPLLCISSPASRFLSVITSP